MSLTDAHRNIRFTCSLGEDVLLVQGLRGQESVSAPFSFELDLVSEFSEVAIHELLSKPVTVSLILVDGSWRHFHGLISRISSVGRSPDGLSLYRAEMVPWLWFLNLTSDCRIFPNMTVQEIVTQVFDDLDFCDYEFRGLTAGQARRVYTVQYRESAFNFVSRLLEEEGIYYFFEHNEDRHLLVLADAPLEHPPCPGQNEVLVSGLRSAPLEEDFISDMVTSTWVQPSRVSLGDFNFEKPGAPLRVAVAADGRFEVYDYPGPYQTQEEGDVLARVRLEEHIGGTQRQQGSSNCRAFVSGHRVTLREYHHAEVEKVQVLHKIIHEARQSFDGDGASGGGLHYRNTFTCFPHSLPFRPPRTARKPVIVGTQTAIVVGPGGEEIYTDEHGRVKIQFHWDRRGKMDQNSSCWVRVSHHWAGKRWGTLFLPRIGQEVIVDHLEGDPDRPIIIGRVYNAEQVPPYNLPAEQTKSTIRTESSKGGGGFNELRFEDRTGDEEIFMHAQKDLNLKVLNDRSEDVLGHVTETCHKTRTTTVTQDVTENYDATQTTTVKGDVSQDYRSNVTTRVKGRLSARIKGPTRIKIKSTLNTEVVGKVKEELKAGIEQTVTGNATHNVTVNRTDTIGGNLTVNVTAQSILTAASHKVITPDSGLFTPYDARIVGFRFLMVVARLQIFGASYQVFGIKSDLAGLKHDQAGLKAETYGAHIKQVGAVVTNAAVRIKKAVAHIIG